MELRDYQSEGVNAIRKQWETENNVLYVLTCRGGKTPVIAHIIKHNVGGSVAIAHRSELVTQMSRTLAKNGVAHKIIGSVAVQHECTKAHLLEVGRNFVDPNSHCAVASVDTLIRMNADDPWFKKVTLWVIDECHHITSHSTDDEGNTIKGNKWGKAVNMFPNAKGLGVTATPCRTDGRGLSANTDGVFDALVIGPKMRELEARQFIAPFKIFAPTADINMEDVRLNAAGEYENRSLSRAVHRSHITGDVVKHYQKLTPGKMAMVFCVDVIAATEQTAAFISAGIPTAMVTATTPTQERIRIQQQHKNGQLQVIVNVDLYGEGVDVPALDVVIMARPTQSFGLFFQQFNRCLTPFPDKIGVIIDHVGNVSRHSADWVRFVSKGLWSMDRRDRRARIAQTDIVQVRTCPGCLGVYERILGPTCPYCDETAQPQSRSGPVFVDGDLTELSIEAMAALRGQLDKAKAPPKIPYGATPAIEGALKKHHREKMDALYALRDAMAKWAAGMTDNRKAQRAFYLTFGIDVITAQTGKRVELVELTERIKNESVNRIDKAG